MVYFAIKHKTVIATIKNKDDLKDVLRVTNKNLNNYASNAYGASKNFHLLVKMFDYCLSLNYSCASLCLFCSDFENDNFRINIYNLKIHKFDQALKKWVPICYKNSKAAISKNNLAIKLQKVYEDELKKEKLEQENQKLKQLISKRKNKNRRNMLSKRRKITRKTLEVQSIVQPKLEKSLPIDQPQFITQQDKKNRTIITEKCNIIKKQFLKLDDHLNHVFGLESCVSSAKAKEQKLSDYLEKYLSWASNKLNIIINNNKIEQERKTQSDLKKISDMLLKKKQEKRTYMAKGKRRVLTEKEKKHKK